MVELVEDPDLQELLVGDTHLHGVVGRAVLLVPLAGEGDVLRAAHVPAAQVERARGPVERDAVRRAVGEEGRVIKKRLHVQRELEGVEVDVGHILRAVGHGAVGGQRVHDGIVVERRQIGIVGLDVVDGLVVVRRQGHLPRARVVEEGERDAVLGAQLLPDDDLVDVVELVPVLVLVVHVAVQRLELRASGNGHVQSLRGVERLLLEEVEVVLVHEIGEQLVRQTVQHALLREGEAPLAVARAVDLLGVEQRHGVVEPVDDGLVLRVVEAHLDRLEGLHVEHVVAVVERRLLVVEGREAHALEVAAVALLAAHHDPHRAPLGQEDRLDDLLALGAERDGAARVVHGAAVANLLPRHGHVLQQFVDRVRQVLQRSQVDALVVPELSRGHVSVVLDDLADVLRRHLLLLLLDNAELPLLAVALRVERLPLTRLLVEQLLLRLRGLRHPRGIRTSASHAAVQTLRGAGVHLLLGRPRHAGRQNEGIQGHVATTGHLPPLLEVEHGCSPQAP
mmetsp:Transcript_40931/g.121364  ORF Transcript_40931/g.121364 Transcript_40931/m.121364 type:complete len:508 (+) Transcript_40931:5381-6904(+)